MSKAGDRQGLNLDFSVHHIGDFLRDRCSDLRRALKLDKRVRPDNSGLSGSIPHSQGLHATAVTGPSRDSSALHRPGHAPIGASHWASVTREDLGRATWLLLHTLAAQYPDKPNKQQKKDVTMMVRPMCPIV